MKPPEVPLLALSLVEIAAGLVVGAVRPARGWFILTTGVAALALALAARGLKIGYVPLTERPESVAGFVLCAGTVALYTDRWIPPTPSATWRLYRGILLAPVVLLLAWSVLDWRPAGHPVPLLVTIWYVIHVPLYFVAYGIWTAAFAAAVVRLTVPRRAVSSPIGTRARNPPRERAAPAARQMGARSDRALGAARRGPEMGGDRFSGS